MPKTPCWFALLLLFGVAGCTLPSLGDDATDDSSEETCTDETRTLAVDATFESSATGEIIELGSYLEEVTPPFVGTYTGSLGWDQLGTTTELTLTVERDSDQLVTLYYCGALEGVEVPANVFLRSSDRRLDLAFTGELAIDDSGNLLPGYDRVEMPSEALPLDQIGVPAERIHDRRWRLWAHWHVQPAGNPPFSTIAISMTSSTDSSLPTLPLATGTFASNP